MRAEQEIKDAGGLLAVLRNGHADATVLVDARRNAADEIEYLRLDIQDVLRKENAKLRSVLERIATGHHYNDAKILAADALKE